MAERRMMSRKVTDDDHFMALSSSAQALYLHLMMSADDDGFNNQVTIAMFRAHASVQDLQALLESKYLYQFENGVIVIRHFRMANALRKDRYNPTTFQKDLTKLEIDERGVYHLKEGDMVASWLPDGCQVVADLAPQVSIDKVSKDKGSIGKDNKPPKSPLKGESVGDLIEDFTIDEEVRQALKDFVDMRRSIKKPITPRGMKQVLSKLRKLATRPDIQVKILEQSIEHDWQTVYELKTEQTDSSLGMMEEWLRNRGNNDS